MKTQPEHTDKAINLIQPIVDRIRNYERVNVNYAIETGDVESLEQAIKLLTEFASQQEPKPFPTDEEIEKSFWDCFNSDKWPRIVDGNRLKWVKDIWRCCANWLRDTYL